MAKSPGLKEEADAALARFIMTHQTARAAKARDDFVEATNLYLDALLTLRCSWINVRLSCFQEFLVLLEKQQSVHVTFTPDQFQKAKIMAEDIREMAIFRSMAYFALATNVATEYQFDLAAKYHRRIIDIVRETRAKARTGAPSRPGTFSEWNITTYGFAADGVTEATKPLSVHLEIMENASMAALQVYENGLGVEEFRKELMETCGSDETILKRMVAGGATCDCCGRKANEIAYGELSKCSRCKQAYYCSAACQKKQWKQGGHKQACRAPGQIEQGDIMLVKGIVSKPELNRKLVKVVRAVSSGGSWEVNVQGSNGTISLASDKLVHIRPAK